LESTREASGRHKHRSQLIWIERYCPLHLLGTYLKAHGVDMAKYRVAPREHGLGVMSIGALGIPMA